MRPARGPQSKQEWDLTNSEWSVNAKAEIVVWRQHWSSSQTPEQKVPEVILRDVTRLGTLMRPRGNTHTTVRAFGTACPLTWDQPPAPQADEQPFRFGVPAAAIILHTSCFAYGRIGTGGGLFDALKDAGLTTGCDPQSLMGTWDWESCERAMSRVGGVGQHGLRVKTLTSCWCACCPRSPCVPLSRNGLSVRACGSVVCGCMVPAWSLAVRAMRNDGGQDRVVCGHAIDASTS